MPIRRTYARGATGALTVTDSMSGDITAHYHQNLGPPLRGAATLTVDTAGTWDVQPKGLVDLDIAAAQDLLVVLQADLALSHPNPRAF